MQTDTSPPDIGHPRISIAAPDIKKVERRVAKDEKEMQKETQKLPKK